MELWKKKKKKKKVKVEFESQIYCLTLTNLLVELAESLELIVKNNLNLTYNWSSKKKSYIIKIVNTIYSIFRI